MTTLSPSPAIPSVAIIGGGQAGLAAAAAAAEQGLRVDLFEARRRLGGRVGSFRDPASGQWVDFCQHVAMGCCTHLDDFCGRIGIAGSFARHRTLHFVAPDGSQHDFAAVGWLPCPLHLFPGLLRLKYLGLGERLRIMRTLGRLAGERPGSGRGDVPIGPWLRQQGESQQAIEWFWSVVLQSALSESLERASLFAARKVFVDGFLASRRAHELVLPTVPLSDIFDRQAGAWLAARGVAVHLAARIRQIDGDRQGARAIVLPDGSTRRFDFCIAAVPWHAATGLFSQALLDALPALAQAARIQSAPITAVHLWFDRPITPLPHAVLIGRLSQWLFNHGPQPTASGESSPACHYEVVISASHELLGLPRAQIATRVREELSQTWPAARHAQLLRWRVISQPSAVFSVCPESEPLRPAQQTAVANLMLAGDWTSTGWPGTMEGAVRSGYLAVEAILRALGRFQPIGPGTAFHASAWRVYSGE